MSVKDKDQQGPQILVIPRNSPKGDGLVDLKLKPTVRIADPAPVQRPKRPLRKIRGR